MQESISTASDVLFLQEYADSDRLRVLELLSEKPKTQKELAAALDLNSGTLSRHMAGLTAAGLVVRERGHGPYALVAPKETLDLIRAATRLSVVVARIHFEASQEREREIDRLVTNQADRGSALDDG